MNSDQSTIHCPYNSLHVLSSASFVKHLKKCKQTNKHLFTQCDFNPLHIVRKRDIENHYKTCLERKEVIGQNMKYDWFDKKTEDLLTFQREKIVKRHKIKQTWEKEEIIENTVPFISNQSQIEHNDNGEEIEEISIFRELLEIFEKNGHLQEK